MTGDARDWLHVVYGPGLEPEAGAGRRASRMEIAVRQTPAEVDLPRAPGEQRVRVTVVPSDRRQGWTLWLSDYAAGSAEEAGSRIWWRVEPGTWQPLGESRQRVAEGRGRIRLDVSLRRDGGPGVPPRFRFEAEPTADRV